MIEDDPDTGSTQLDSSVLTVARCLAIISGAAAAIHFAVADMHYEEYWAFGAFMVGAALVQIAWSGAALLTSRRWLWATGAVINGGIVAVYLVTRIVGDVIGPTPHEVEPVGFGDALCTVFEALIAVVCLALLAGWQPRPHRRQASTWTTGIFGAVTAVLLIAALFDGGSEMTMSSDDDASAAPASAVSAGGMHMAMPMTSGATATKPASIHLATKSPAGAISMPKPGMQMAAGMSMASSTACTASPTAAQQAATVELVNTSWAAAQRFRRLAVAKANGYVPITPTGLPVVHYINLDAYKTTLLGGPAITPNRPQSLVYANTSKGAVLVASMYLTRPGTTTPPQPGGCLTQWHKHTNLCFGSFATVVGVTHGGTCAAGSVNRTTAPMLHVWYVPIPGGPTAIDAPDSQVVRAAERVASPHNATA